MSGAASYVSLTDLRRVFRTRGGSFTALDGVSLEVAPGEIFGVIGRSGAGKSTLIRCVNQLERPDGGRVVVAGQDMGTIDGAGLVRARRGIGMVFQHFNLLANRTAAGNVALPLELAGVPAREIEPRVAELLSLVGLQDRASAYPAQLSGGQKQRVGIARALANRPGLLLLDEATSALDPETTGEILALIRELRDRLSLTVLLITHEMAVVKAVCDRVAVLERGRVVEQGRVFDVFTRPATPVARAFVAEVIGDTVPPGTLDRLPPPPAGEERRLVRILFAGPHATRAVISEASRWFDVDMNILSGRIDEIGGAPFGLMAVAVGGRPDGVAAALAFLRGLDLVVDEIGEHA